jgi:dTDP-glucose 4,6-dehydratase
MTVLEFAKVIEDITGSRAGIVHVALPEDDPKRRRPDITKAKRLLGWSPAVTLEEGMRDTVEYFRGVHCSDAVSIVA